MMQVNELAKQCGVPPQVVRYYTQIGLLTPQRDRKNRYRDHAASDVHRVRFIRRAKWSGFPLKDVQAILADADAGRSLCLEVREIVNARARENHERQETLQRLQRRVENAMAVRKALSDRPPDHDSLRHLPIPGGSRGWLDLSGSRTSRRRPIWSSHRTGCSADDVLEIGVDDAL